MTTDTVADSALLPMGESSPDLLWRWAATDPDFVVFTAGRVDAVDGRPSEHLTYADLARGARSASVHMVSAGVEPGDTVVIALPNGLAYPIAAYGAMAAGAIAVPLFPPDGGRHAARVHSVLLEARPAAVVTTATAAPQVHVLLDQLQLDRCRVLTVEEHLGEDRADQWRPVPPHRVAFLQYTSGSTTTPKGVMVSHANLRANSAAIGAAFGHDRSSRGVCWLPLFHDMGIVGSVFHTVGLGGRCHFMTPTEFLSNPARWLQAISLLGADTTGGPSFAFDWCTRKAKERHLDGVDLSTWTVAYNGSEPISVATMDRFAARFEPYGFRRESFLPCYGLAEQTLLVAASPLATPGMVSSFDQNELHAGRVVETQGDDGKALVASGTVEGSATVRIVDEEGKESAPARQGQILVSGPSRALGYWRNSAATDATFGTGEGDPHPGFLRTGDLGFIHEGLLFVTGRAKELIVVRGRNIHPHDVEAVALKVGDGQLEPQAVAFAVPGDDSEELAVLVEAPRKLEDQASWARRIRLAVLRATGVQPRFVGLVPRRTIPKTSSGKLRRLEAATEFACGRMETLFVDEFTARGTGRPRPDDLGVAYRAPTGAIAETVAAVWAAVLGIEDPGVDDDFVSLGGDSLQAAQIAAELAVRFGVDVELSDLFQTPTVAEVAALVEKLQRGAGNADADFEEIVI